MKRLQKLILLIACILYCNSCTKKPATTNKYNQPTISIADSLFNIRKIDSALYYYKKGISEYHNSDSINYFKSLLGISHMYCYLQNIDSARIFMNNADSLYFKYQHCPLIASLYWNKKGYFYINNGEYNKSIDCFYNAISEQTKATSAIHSSLARMYSNIGNNYYFLNDLNEALKFYQKALTISKKYKQPYNLESCFYLDNLGLVYTELKQFDEAENVFEKSNIIISKNVIYDSLFLANHYNLYSHLYNETDNYEQKIHYLNLASNIFISNPKNFKGDLINTLMETASTYITLKQFENALLLYNQTINIAKQYYSNDPKTLNRCMYLKGYIFLGQKKYLEAESCFKSAVEFAFADSPFYLANLCIDLSKCYIGLNKPQNAIDILNRLKKNDKQLEEYQNIEVSQLLAKAFMLNADYKNAYNELFIALQSSKQVKNESYIKLKLLNSIGEYWLKVAKPQNALNSFEEVILQSANNYFTITPANSFYTFSNDELQTALIGKAESWKQIAQLQSNSNEKIKALANSLNAHEAYIDLVNNQRKQIPVESDQMVLSKSLINSYNEAINISCMLYRLSYNNEYLNKAFQFADVEKVTTLIGNINDLKNKKIGNVPNYILEYEKKLKNDIAYFQNSLYESSNENTSDEIQKQKRRDKLIVLLNSLNELNKKLEIQYPEYYWLKYQVKQINIDGLYQNIGNKKAIIEYVFTNDSLYTFVIANNKTHLFSFKANNNLTQLIHKHRNYTSTIADIVYTKEYYADFIQTSNQLYKILIEPCEKYIQGKELIIIPDNELSLIPFETLIKESTIHTSTDYGVLSYLIKNHTISYSYSSNLLLTQTINNIPDTIKGLIAFAPVYETVQPNNALPDESFKRRELRDVLKPIKGTKEEAKKVADIYNGKVYLNNVATESLFKGVNKNGKIIHLAMHTAINNEYPMYSKLIFSPEKDSINDGFLNTYEIYNLNQNSPLVVLSACNTGYGKIMSGEGVMNLARGFIYAGCKSLVVTLWSIADKTSSALMTYFYTHLYLNENKNDALRLAKLQYIKNSDGRYSHPYYWSGYILIGNTQKMYYNKRTNYNLITLTMSLVIALSVIYVIRNNKKP